MREKIKTPAMSSHKAVYAGIAAVLTPVVLSLLGLMPTTEAMLTADLQQLIVNLAELALLGLVPGIVAYWKRNVVK